MANIIKDVKVAWEWLGDTYALKGFNVALTKVGETPNDATVAFSSTGASLYEHIFRNVSLTNQEQFEAWVQALYVGDDSDWVSTAGVIEPDDGASTLITQQDAQDLVDGTLDLQAPNVPTNLTLTTEVDGVDDQQSAVIIASWDESIDPEGNPVTYEVEYRIQGSLSKVLKVIPTEHETIRLEGLQINTTYEVRVRAADPSGNRSGFCPIETITTPTAYTNVGTPLDPELVGGGTTFSGREPSFVWDAGSSPSATNFKDYQVEISTAGGTLLRNEHVATPYYTYTYEKNVTDSGAIAQAPQRSIRIRVRRRTKDGQNGPWSNYLVVSNGAPATGTISVLAFFDSAEVRYTRPSDSDFSGSRVYVSDTTPVAITPSNLKYDGPETQPIYINGLEAGTQYYFRVVPYDLFGEGAPSASVGATTAFNPFEDETPPDAPGAPTITSTVEQRELYVTARANVNWPASSGDDSGRFEYEVQFGVDGFLPTVLKTVDTSAVFFPVQVGKTYRARVRAVDYSGNASAFSAWGYHTIAGDSTPPSAPTTLNATPGLDKVVLTWVNPSDSDFLQVNVHRSTSSGFTPNAGNLIAQTRASVYVDNEVTNGTWYYYKVIAVDVTGNQSAPSNGSSALPFKISDANVDLFLESAAITNAYIQNLDAAKIDTGTLNANRIAASSITAAKLDVSQLSAITADLGEVTAGTITGALIRTSAGADRVELSSVGIRMYDNNNLRTYFNVDGSGRIGNTSGITIDSAGNVSIPQELLVGTIEAEKILTTSTPYYTEISSVRPFYYGTAAERVFEMTNSGKMYIRGGLKLENGADLWSGSHTAGANDPSFSQMTSGFWLGQESGVTKLKMINSASQYLTYDSGDLEVVGGLIKTAPSGSRIEMDGSDNKFKAWESGIGTPTIEMGVPTSNGSKFTGSYRMRFNCPNNHAIHINGGGFNAPVVAIEGVTNGLFVDASGSALVGESTSAGIAGVVGVNGTTGGYGGRFDSSNGADIVAGPHTSLPSSQTPYGGIRGTSNWGIAGVSKSGNWRIMTPEMNMNNNGYFQLDTFCIQFGHQDQGAASGTVTFGQAMLNCRSVQCTYHVGGSTRDEAITVTSVSGTGFTYQRQGTSNNRFYWMAIGQVNR